MGECEGVIMVMVEGLRDMAFCVTAGSDDGEDCL